MKEYEVTLRDNRAPLYIRAHSYDRDDKHYVFRCDDETEVQFVAIENVIAITESRSGDDLAGMGGGANSPRIPGL
jgi:hypothetical protein